MVFKNAQLGRSGRLFAQALVLALGAVLSVLFLIGCASEKEVIIGQSSENEGITYTLEKAVFGEKGVRLHYTVVNNSGAKISSYPFSFILSQGGQHTSAEPRELTDPTLAPTELRDGAQVSTTTFFPGTFKDEQPFEIYTSAGILGQTSAAADYVSPEFNFRIDPNRKPPSGPQVAQTPLPPVPSTATPTAQSPATAGASSVEMRIFNNQVEGTVIADGRVIAQQDGTVITENVLVEATAVGDFPFKVVFTFDSVTRREPAGSSGTVAGYSRQQVTLRDPVSDAVIFEGEGNGHPRFGDLPSISTALLSGRGPFAGQEMRMLCECRLRGATKGSGFTTSMSGVVIER